MSIKKISVGIMGGIGLVVSIALIHHFFGETAMIVSLLPVAIVWIIIMGLIHPVGL